MFVVPVTRHALPVSRSFDRLFDDGVERFFHSGSDAARSPALDVVESDTAYTVKLDMPGVAKEDVKVSIDGRLVTVQAKSAQDSEKKDGDRIVYRERASSSYSRSFKLAQEVEQSTSAAKLENGVLSLTLAKRHAPTAAHITVN